MPADLNAAPGAGLKRDPGGPHAAGASATPTPNTIYYSVESLASNNGAVGLGATEETLPE